MKFTKVIDVGLLRLNVGIKIFFARRQNPFSSGRSLSANYCKAHRGRSTYLQYIEYLGCELQPLRVLQRRSWRDLNVPVENYILIVVVVFLHHLRVYGTRTLAQGNYSGCHQCHRF